MKSFFMRNGTIKPIKVLITITWLFLFCVWFLFLVAIWQSIFGDAELIGLVDVMFKGVTGLLAQLLITLSADIYSKKNKGGTVENIIAKTAGIIQSDTGD